MPTSETAGNIQIIDISEGPFEDEVHCTGPKDRLLKNFADRGVNTIIRYYSDKNNTTCKNITPYERDILHGYGFNIAIVYQYQGRAPGRYNAAHGVADAELCLNKANEIKQPDGSAIYFGIDADASTHNPSDVVAYLDAVNKKFAGRFAIGCYGAGTVCRRALDHPYIAFTWVPEAPAWDGTQDFMNDKLWTFYQNKTDMTKSGLSDGRGYKVDTNFVNPKFDTIGAFRKDGTPVKYDRTEVGLIASQRKWVNISELPIFDRPHGTKVTHMCIARMVRVLSDIDQDWVNVDIDEDGEANGVCEKKYLSPLDKMPKWTNVCSPVSL